MKICIDGLLRKRKRIAPPRVKRTAGVKALKNRLHAIQLRLEARNYKDERDALKAQNDELLAALKLAREAIDGVLGALDHQMSDPDKLFRAKQRARQALAAIDAAMKGGAE